MTNYVPLWAVASMNDEVLPESTANDMTFEYVDISNVTEGRIADDVETYAFANAPSRARRIARGGDVVISTVRTYLRAIAQVPLHMGSRVFSTGFAVLRPSDRTDARYLAYVLGSRQVIDEIVVTSVGVSYPAIQGSALHRIRVPHHDLETQQRIADYLDRETGEIDAMLAKMDELTTTLASRRAAAVDQSLESSFGNRMAPIWALLSPVKEQNHPMEEVLSVYRDFGVIPKSSRDDNHNRTPKDLTSYQLVLVGDLVINKMKAWQGSLGVSNHRGIVSPDYQVARPRVLMDPRFLHAVLRSPRMIPQYRVRSTGVRPSQWRLYWEDFADLMVPMPPLAEQTRIADHLDEVTGKIDHMLAKTAELKSLLIERRSALITDVVTGKKQVHS